MKYYFAVLISLLTTVSCKEQTVSVSADNKKLVRPDAEVSTYQQIKNIPLPQGYKLTENKENSFAAWLGNISLKSDKTVYLYDGHKKQNQAAQFAVLDISVGKKNLQQCADAVMRLRAEYLFEQKKYDEIVFMDNDGKKYSFGAPYNRAHFTKFLDVVYGMCGTASLSKQLKTCK